MDLTFNKISLSASDEIRVAVDSIISGDSSSVLHSLSVLRKKLKKSRENILFSLSYFPEEGERREAKAEEDIYKSALKALEQEDTKRAQTLFSAKCMELTHMSARRAAYEDDIRKRHFIKRLRMIENDIKYIDAAAYHIQKQTMKG